MLPPNVYVTNVTGPVSPDHLRALMTKRFVAERVQDRPAGVH